MLQTPGEYKLMELPYAADALEPHISAKIVALHHGKHHAAYVKNANAALADLSQARQKADTAGVKAQTEKLAFNGSGVMLHDLYWVSMKPGGGGEPKGELLDAIKRDFGSYDAFQKQFVAAAAAVTGSGWALLAYEPKGGRLVILMVHDHQDGTIWGVVPLMVCDVWEHAYYLQYENRRPEYIEAFMKVVDWDSTAKRLATAMKSGK